MAPLLDGGDDQAAALSRLRAELEQAMVTAEDAQQEVARLSKENIALRDRLRQAQTAHEVTQAQAETFRQELEARRCASASDGRTDEELRAAVEELQVMAEELEHANGLLRRAGGFA